MNTNKTIRPFLFIILFIPYILHRYAMNTSLLYWDEILIPIFFILVFMNRKMKLEFDYEAKLYLYFLITVTLPLILFQVNYIHQIGKYIFFFLIYLSIFRVHLVDRVYYDIFINIILIYIFISFSFYYFDFVLELNFYENFPIDKMTLPASLRIVSKESYSYYFPFYLYVVPDVPNIPHNQNLFGFLRYYGPAFEPTAFSMILLPLVFISLDLKRFIAAGILSAAIFVVSSYAAIILWVLFILININFTFLNNNFNHKS